MKSFLFALSFGVSCVALAETTVPQSAQVGMNVTIYNENRALIKDERKVDLTQGLNELAFQGVSANMMPQTALLKGKGLNTVEQNFNFDLLTKEALLEKSVGKQVTTEYIDPATGRATRQTATLLAYNNGRPVLKINGKVEADYPGRIIFDSVPENLRAEPTLVVSVSAPVAVQKETVELDYLTLGLSWKADYVARLSDKGDKMALNGFVTLRNNSGAAYHNALLQLVAGDVNTVVGYKIEGKVAMAFASVSSMADNAMEAEALADFYIYTVPHKTTLLSNQTKQVALLSGQDIPVRKEYKISTYFNNESKGMKPKIYLSFENEKSAHLGIPLPKGVMRIYKEDLKGNTQFVGEDRINHTAEKETVRLNLGEAFNLTVDSKRTDYQKISDKLKNVAYEVTFKNASENPEKVVYEVRFAEGFKLLNESQQSRKENATTRQWVVAVPAKAEAKLTYKVQYE